MKIVSMKVALSFTLSLSLLVLSMSNLPYQWMNNYQHRAAGREMAGDFNWNLILSRFRNNPDVELNQLAKETHAAGGYSHLYVYSLFNTQSNELALYSSVVYEQFGYKGSVQSAQLIDHLKPLTKTSDMTIRNIKYTLIQETVIQWLLKMRKTLKYIAAIECYEEATSESTFYILKAYTTSNKNLFRVILEEKKGQLLIVKSYDI